MPNKHHILQLGVNVDHIATLRQARGVSYPDPMMAADIARKAGADGITVHLREDRRHIQDDDVFNIKNNVALPLNFEMAATSQMLDIAKKVQPAECCLVPEKRQELTTEGGLNVINQIDYLTTYIADLKQQGTKVSLFIDADVEQIKASQQAGADIVELHTGVYADSTQPEDVQRELERIRQGVQLAHDLGLQVNAGHGLHYQNIEKIAAIEQIVCLNIGHAIVARAVITGFHEAVFAMKQLMINARLKAEQ